MSVFTASLLAVAKEVPDLRRAVRAHLGAPCPEVELCVSELLANVITHVGEGTPVTVLITTANGLVHVQVTDPDPRALPTLRSAQPDDEGGRGLALLDAVALRWGVVPEPGRKTVWCELPAVRPGPVFRPESVGVCRQD
ncbi:ATP-binding protein [Streptomyces sp. NPDC046887]|uniref:ATP-binding protein n=1 Tax=Streptomyces sp. NPDC046887 TaxID=3155472 RepID=UPI003407FA08